MVTLPPQGDQQGGGGTELLQVQPFGSAYGYSVFQLAAAAALHPVELKRESSFPHATTSISKNHECDIIFLKAYKNK